MSFDIEPDAPLHGECAAEIKRLEAMIELQKSAIDEVKFFLTTVVNEDSQYSCDGHLMANGYAHAKDLLEKLEADFKCSEAEK